MAAHDTPAAIARGLAYIRSVQLPDGSIAGRSSDKERPFKPQITYHTTFTPALILSALSGVPDAADIRSPLASWLAAQRSEAWSFNYWARTSKEYRTMSYPDDLDDTFCALSALYLHDPASINADALGSVVRLLIATEQAVGGPYRTCLASPDSAAIWQDVDLAVNSNIAYFLRMVAEPLPNVTAYLEQAISSGTFTSPYYPQKTPLLYYLARAYRGPKEAALTSHIRKQPVSTPLHTALIVSSLLELGHGAELGPAVAKLRSWQLADGSWPAEAFCIDPARRGTTFYHGSKALTTAFAIEALTRYERQQPARSDSPHTTTPRAANAAITMAIAATDDLDDAVRIHTVSMLETTAAGDESHEIAGLPYLFKQSLAIQPVLPSQLLARLGAANLFGWLAYTIYDNFLDDEGDPTQLSVANIALRRSLDGFMQALPSHTEFRDLVHHTFDRIDAANAWEIDHCRMAVTDQTVIVTRTLPHYGQLIRLADRSLGHTLSPMAILSSIGYAPHSPAAQAIHTMLTNYLIARQLNDDMHDWEQDLRRGHISYAVRTIFKTLNLPAGTYEFDDLLPKAQREFWHRSLPMLCDRTERHIKKARAAAKASGILAEQSAIIKLLDNLQTVVDHTRSEQTKAEQFLNAYRKPVKHQ